jgi:hypothetical protein
MSQSEQNRLNSSERTSWSNWNVCHQTSSPIGRPRSSSGSGDSTTAQPVVLPALLTQARLDLAQLLAFRFPQNIQQRP